MLTNIRLLVLQYFPDSANTGHLCREQTSTTAWQLSAVQCVPEYVYIS